MHKQSTGLCPVEIYLFYVCLSFIYILVIYLVLVVVFYAFFEGLIVVIIILVVLEILWVNTRTFAAMSPPLTWSQVK